MSEAAGLGIVDNLITLVETFTDVALSDPLSAALLTVGAVLTGFSVVVFGYLSVGALAKGLMDSFPTGEGPSQPGR